MKECIKYELYKFFGFLIMIILPLASFAQTPRNVPQGHDSEPVQLDNVPNLIMYIIIPIIIVILYLLWRRREKRRNR